MSFRSFVANYGKLLLAAALLAMLIATLIMLVFAPSRKVLMWMIFGFVTMGWIWKAVNKYI